MSANCKVAAITGGGRGIGRAIALRLADEGYSLALCARTTEQVEETAALCQRRGVRAEAWGVDVADADQVFEWASSVREKLGPPSVLINNAGIFLDKPLLETEIGEWDKVIAVNLRGPFLCIRAFVPDMVAAGGGHVINIASTSGKKPYERQGAYCASKYGLLGLTKVLALELREHGVRVSAICPGGVDTELVRGHLDRPDWLQPEDVAEVVAFLLKLPARAAIDEVIIRRFTSTPY
ncbi:MAG: SDR family oxidoreductase [Armatimonadetes bacterium]|nr:SDR family oxidoreductase [Armatimonadota bacterium]